MAIMWTNFSQLFLFALLALANARGVDRIVGGTSAPEGTFKYMVSFRIKGNHICGGAIVSPTHVLTAAHCIKAAAGADINDLGVYSGSVHLIAGPKGPERHAVEAIFANPDYEVNPDADVGIIKLREPIVFNDRQQPIKISSKRPPENRYAIISGWGQTEYPSNAIPDNLQYQLVRIIKFSACQSIFRDITTAICTLNAPGVGTCDGDSGSPLVYHGEVVAVVSRGVLCAKGVPDLYSSTADNLDFIQEAMSL